MTKLHIANAFFEHELRGPKDGTLVQAFERHPIFLQLQFLPFLTADPHDAVALTALPDSSYFKLLKHSHFPPLKPHLLNEGHLLCYQQVESWGASLLIQEWAQKRNLPYFIPPWHLVKEIQSKAFSFHHTPRLPHSALLQDEKSARSWLASFSGPKVLKTCFGLSGRGHLWIDSATPIERILHFLQKEAQLGHPVIAEPWVKRTLDFSTQWEISQNKEISYLGATVCLNDERGTYRGTQIADEPTLFGKLLPFFEEHQAAAEAVVVTLAERGYFGNVGIDAFVYQQGSALHLHPIVEINARKTMGWVGLMIQRKTFPRQVITIRF